MVRHPHFNQPIFVKFPRPNILRGPDGTKKFPPAEDLALDEAVWRNLSRLDSQLSRNEVRDVVAAASDPAEIVRAMNLTLQGTPKDVSSHFRNSVRKKAGVREVMSDMPSVVIADPDPNDPFQD